MSALRHGSDATSLHGPPIQSHLIPWMCRGVACKMLSRSPTCRLLNGSQHLPLQRKEPAWLLHNSRPVLLKPFLACGVTTILWRLMHKREGNKCCWLTSLLIVISKAHKLRPCHSTSVHHNIIHSPYQMTMPCYDVAFDSSLSTFFAFQQLTGTWIVYPQRGKVTQA